MTARHVTQKNMDFSISSRKEMQQARADTMNSMNTFLLAIAAVSLIVGSIGIANTMFTSVLEKTKEIGIMKLLARAIRIFCHIIPAYQASKLKPVDALRYE